MPAELPSCICVEGYAVSDKLTAIYGALFVAADDDTLTDPKCIRGYPIAEQLNAIYAVMLTFTDEENLPTANCLRGYPIGDQLNAIYCAAVGASLIDPDAAAFIAAAGITDDTQKEAVNQLVVDLKAEGIWTKLRVLYPFVGGAASPHSYNLVNPATFQITWNGTLTHNASGVTGNGTTGYGDTGFNPNAQALLWSNASLGAYVNSAGSVALRSLIVAQSDAATSEFLLIENSAAAVTFDSGNYSGRQGSYPIASPIGHFAGSRGGAADERTYMDGVLVGALPGVGAAPMPNLSLFLFAFNYEGGAVLHSNQTMASAMIGESLTGAEHLALYNAIQTYQTTLGRSV